MHRSVYRAETRGRRCVRARASRSAGSRCDRVRSRSQLLGFRIVDRLVDVALVDFAPPMASARPVAKRAPTTRPGPLPQAKLSPSAETKIAETEGRKETSKHDGKGKVEAARPGVIASGKPSSGVKTKIIETDGRKEAGRHDGKARTESTVTGKTATGKPPTPPKSKTSRSKSRNRTAKSSRSPRTPPGMGRWRHGQTGKPPLRARAHAH